MFFSGFSLSGEDELFSEYLIDNEVTISGFSYGAVKAFEYALKSEKRVDKLQLFSPAFFQTQNEKFKKMQMMFFKKDASSYGENFLKNCGFDDEMKNKYFSLGTAEELDHLLYYIWDEKKLQLLKEKGIMIEVYLGGEDKIIDPKMACDFFKNYGEVYYIKSASHILR